MQLTGKDNYREMGKVIGVDLVSNPELAATPENSRKIAIEFWKINVPLAGRESVEKATLAINGGTNGLADRQALFRKLSLELTPGFLEEFKKQHLPRINDSSPSADKSVVRFKVLGTVVKSGTNEQFTVGELSNGKTGLFNSANKLAFPGLNGGISLKDVQNLVNLRDDLKSTQNPDTNSPTGRVPNPQRDAVSQQKPINPVIQPRF